MLNPVAMSIVRNVFEDPRERAQAIGVWGAVFGISMALGPVLGGALGRRDRLARRVPRQRAGRAARDRADRARSCPSRAPPRPRRIDPVGQLLVIVALASLTYAIIEGGPGRLDLARDPRRCSRSRRPASPRSSPTSCAATSRCSRSASSAARRSRARARSRSALFAAIGGFLFLNTLYLQERARPVAVSRRPVHAADGGDDVRVRADLGQLSWAATGRGRRWWRGGAAVVISAADADRA